MLGELLGGIGGTVGGIAVMAGAAGKDGKEYYKRALQELMKLEPSQFDMRSLAAPELEFYGDLTPQGYEVDQFGDVMLPEDDPTGRNYQLRGLAGMEDFAREGFDLESRLAAEDVQRSIATQNRRNREAILSEMAARGMGGSGMELSARMEGAQDAANSARSAGNDLAALASRNRMMALSEMASRGGELRAGDFRAANAKADHWNRFNEFLTQLGTESARYNAQMQNAAEERNLGRREDVGDANEMSRYEAALADLTRQNALRGTRFGQEFDIAGAKAGQLNTIGGYYDARRQQRAKEIVGLGQSAGQAVGGLAGLGLGI